PPSCPRFPYTTLFRSDLPSDKELRRRAELGLGLTRPELSVLSAWVKMYVFRELMAGDPKALPRRAELLHSYFPPIIEERYGDDRSEEHTSELQSREKL